MLKIETGRDTVLQLWGTLCLSRRNLLSRSGNGMELNAKFREWSRGIAESEQTFLGKAEACVDVVVKEDSL